MSEYPTSVYISSSTRKSVNKNKWIANARMVISLKISVLLALGDS